MKRKRSSSKKSAPQKKRKASLTQEKWLGAAHLYEPCNTKLRNPSD